MGNIIIKEDIREMGNSVAPCCFGKSQPDNALQTNIKDGNSRYRLSNVDAANKRHASSNVGRQGATSHFGMVEDFGLGDDTSLPLETK